MDFSGFSFFFGYFYIILFEGFLRFAWSNRNPLSMRVCAIMIIRARVYVVLLLCVRVADLCVAAVAFNAQIQYRNGRSVLDKCVYYMRVVNA